jgi:lactobin A/cerein 7B family class IIb bacteriocin
MEKIVKTDRNMDAQQTREFRELTAAELESVNGGGSLVGAGIMAVVDAVAEGVVLPLIRAFS